MSTPINRRKFLSRTVQTTGVALAMQSFVARGALAASSASRRRGNKCDGDYGDLAPVASENTGETILTLPEGFKYNVFGRTGTIMSDGRPTPGAHDGMAAFETNDSDDDDDCRDDDRRDTMTAGVTIAGIMTGGKIASGWSRWFVITKSLSRVPASLSIRPAPTTLRPAEEPPP